MLSGKFKALLSAIKLKHFAMLLMVVAMVLFVCEFIVMGLVVMVLALIIDAEDFDGDS